MRFSLKLPYPTLPGDADEVRTTTALLRHAVTQKYPQGLPRVEVRAWAKIEDILDQGGPEVDLTPSQWTFLHDAVMAAAWPVPWSKLVVVFLDAIADAEREG